MALPGLHTIGIFLLACTIIFLVMASVKEIVEEE
jgi:hypothetical protein